MAYINLPRKAEKRVKTIQVKEYQEIYQNIKWRNLRDYKFRHNPICEECEKKGVTTPTQEIHHIIKFSEGRTKREVEALAFSPLNVMALCIKCHKEKHEKYKTDYQLWSKIINGMTLVK